MTEFEKNIVLEQETPVIHFQVEKGINTAALRASSFKPLLDKSMYRFLEKQKDLGNPIDFNGWLLKNSDESGNSEIKAFNYKMHITCDCKGTQGELFKSISDTRKYLLFNKRPAKNDLDEKRQATVYLSNYENININIKSFVSNRLNIVFNGERSDYSLLEFVEKYIKYFLLVYNFGQRPLKGYGSFRVKDDSQSKEQLEEIIHTYFNEEYDVIIRDKKNYKKEQFEDFVCKVIKGLRRDGNLRLAYPVEYLKLVDVEKTKKENKGINDIRKRSVFEHDGKKCGAKEYNDKVKKLFGLSANKDTRYPSPISFTKYGDYYVILLNKVLIENYYFKLNDIKSENNFDKRVFDSLKKGHPSATDGYKEMVKDLLNKLYGEDK